MCKLIHCANHFGLNLLQRQEEKNQGLQQPSANLSNLMESHVLKRNIFKVVAAFGHMGECYVWSGSTVVVSSKFVIDLTRQMKMCVCKNFRSQICGELYFIVHI